MPPRRKPLPPNNVTGKPGSAGMSATHLRYPSLNSVLLVNHQAWCASSSNRRSSACGTCGCIGLKDQTLSVATLRTPALTLGGWGDSHHPCLSRSVCFLDAGGLVLRWKLSQALQQMHYFAQDVLCCQSTRGNRKSPPLNILSRDEIIYLSLIAPLSTSLHADLSIMVPGERLQTEMLMVTEQV